MKLVVATPLYPPEIGGPATYAKLLETGLPEKRIEVEIVKFSDVRHLPKLLRHWAYYRRVLVAAHCADAVLALDPVSVGLPAMMAAWRARKPFVVKIVGDYAWEQGRQRFGVTQELDEFVRARQKSLHVRFLQRIQIHVVRHAARAIVPSEYLKKIITAWGVSERNIQVIYNAVTVEEVGKAPRAIAGLPHPLVVSVGRLVPWKQMGGIIDAVATIPEASLAIVGTGPEEASLATRATGVLPGRFVMTGSLSHQDTLAVLADADVLVSNSSYEGLSHVLIEALALGVPIIATSVGGNPEVVTDGETGLLVPSGDQGALARALATLLGNGPLRLRLGINAKLAAASFSTETMLEETAGLFSRLVTSGMTSSSS